MQFSKGIFLTTTAALLLLIGSCAKQKGPVPTVVGQTCDSTKVSYVLDVKPIVNAKCASAGCHDAST